MTTKSKSAKRIKNTPSRSTGAPEHAVARDAKQSISTGDPPAAARKTTKTAILLSLLDRRDGATIEDLMAATGWQAHSVRGFLAGTAKKKLGLTLLSSKEEGDVRRYRVVDAGVRGR